MKIVTLILLTFLIATHFTLAQEGVQEEEEDEAKNRIGFVAEATFVPEGTSTEHSEESNGDSKGTVVPTIGLEYTRTLSNHWDVGFSAEVELESYIIVEEQLNRENPLILVAFG